MSRTTVFINGRFLTQPATGVQRYALETLRALDELLEGGPAGDAFAFTVLAPSGTPSPGLRNIGFSAAGRAAGHLWEQAWLPWLSRTGLLLSFGPTGPLLRKRQIVTIHDAAVCSVPEAFSWKFRLWYRLLLPVLTRRIACVVTVSQFSKAEVMRHFGAPEHKLRVAGGGWQHVTRLAADSAVLAKHGLSPQQYVFAVSSVSPHKNFAVVARAMAKLRGAGIGAVVAGAADGKVFAQAGSSDLGALKMVGRVSDDELRALYENAAVFVFPSRYEGFGIPPLEAMALGCPVIASTAAAIPEVCGDGALYFRPDDADGLARLIKYVMDSPDARSALVNRARKRLRSHSWEAAAQHFLAALHELRGAEPAEVPRSGPRLQQARA